MLDVKLRYGAFVLILAAGASTALGEDSRKDADLRYLGAAINPAGKGALAELNPRARSYACFDADGELLIGQITSSTWNGMFRQVKSGTRMKARIDTS